LDIFEDLGGCAIVAVIAVVVLLLVVCVAIFVFGLAVSDLTG
jgi:hypothetical protein